MCVHGVECRTDVLTCYLSACSACATVARSVSLVSCSLQFAVVIVAWRAVRCVAFLFVAYRRVESKVQIRIFASFSLVRQV
jgi:hypothetical protein